jgi:20S proteasome alpha/beta subunit
MAYASLVDSFWCLFLLTSASCAPHRRQVEQPKESRFSPYQNNGGTCLAIAGKDFCIVAADSRLSTGYSILSRTSPKVAKLTSKCCIASSGCQADMITLQKHLKFRLQVSVSKLSE